jgi:hypothetical protein
MSETCEVVVAIDPEDARELLRENWRWALGERSVRPVSMTLFGDWFLEDRKDKTIWFLDTCTGRLKQVAGSRAELAKALREKKNRQDWLLEGQLRALRKQKKLLAPGLCYGWKITPGLGGSFELDNIEPTEIAVHQRTQARFACLARSLPPGSRIEPGMADLALEHDPNDGLIDFSKKRTSKKRAPGIDRALLVRCAGIAAIIAIGLVRFLR